MIQIQSSMNKRPGYTLLEVVLSVALAVLLLGGLYVAMWAQYDQTATGRDIVDQATLARSLFRRISSDILSHLPPVDPRLPIASAEETPAEEPAEGEEGEVETEEMMIAESVDLAAASARFNRGIALGTDDLILLTGRYRRELQMGMPPAGNNQPEPGIVSDLRLVRYWLVTEGGKSNGLARVEAANIVSQEELDAVGGEEPPTPIIIAPEVKALSFRYFGDQGGDIDWHEFWDGTAPAPGADLLEAMLFETQAPAEVGPPAAIEITLKLGRLDLNEDDDVEESWTTFRHVVAIPTANGLVPLSELQGLP